MTRQRDARVGQCRKAQGSVRRWRDAYAGQGCEVKGNEVESPMEGQGRKVEGCGCGGRLMRWRRASAGQCHEAEGGPMQGQCHEVERGLR